MYSQTDRSVAVPYSRLDRLCSVERPTGQPVTGLQSEDGVRAPSVRDKVVAVADWRTREPLAALALVREDPFNTSVKPLVIRWKSELARDDAYKAGAIAVAGLG